MGQLYSYVAIFVRAKTGYNVCQDIANDLGKCFKTALAIAGKIRQIWSQQLAGVREFKAFLMYFSFTLANSLAGQLQTFLGQKGLASYYFYPGYYKVGFQVAMWIQLVTSLAIRYLLYSWVGWSNESAVPCSKKQQQTAPSGDQTMQDPI